MKYLKKSLNFFFWILDKLNKKAYIRYYPKYLHWLGVKIDSKNTEGTWISPTVFLDSADYSKIEIGRKITISFGVTILVHDFSIVHAARTLNNTAKQIIYKNVYIGDNVFIGARAMILPGTIIGNNCIVGGGAVVKGKLEPNSIYIGNPGKRIGSVEDFVTKNNNVLG